MGVEGQQPQQHRVQSLKRQETDALAVGQCLANTLGKCQFVVDTMLFSNILSMAFLSHSYTNIMISSGLIYDQLSYGGLLWYIPLEVGAQNIEAFCGFLGLPWWLRWSRICLHC